MSNWDRETVIEKICNSADRFGARNSQQRKQLEFSCSKSPEREVFFGIFAFFFDPSLQENAEQRQMLAGYLLLSLAPPSPINLDGSVYGAAQNWNLSIKELPWYWCKTFGKDVVIEFLEDHQDISTDETFNRAIETMLFFTKGYKDGT